MRMEFKGEVAARISSQTDVLAALVLLIMVELTTTKPLQAARQKRAQACYQDLGCFSTSQQMQHLPMSPDQIKTQFQLYTRTEPHEPVRINATFNESTWNDLMAGSHYHPHKDTKFLIHGYSDNGNETWIQAMKDLLLEKGDFNIIIVDWSLGAKQVPEISATNVFVVAAEVAKFLTYLQHYHGHLDLAHVHLIGHSFGAQISGNVGAKLHGAIGQISGLDPAEPYFIDMDDSRRLDSTDAVFVDVIHSDGERFNGLQGYGMYAAMGDIDFYPNGGIDQPGCEDDLLGGIVGVLGGLGDKSIACSHSRAHQFYLNSLNATTCQFFAYNCTDWATYKTGVCHTCPPAGCPIMGYRAKETGARGSFFLSTTKSSPFCGYEYFVYMDMSDSHPTENAFGRFYLTLHGEHDSEEAEFSRDNVHYRQRTTETQVIAVGGPVGNIRSVEVRFHHQGGLQGWSTGSTVFLHKVVVKDTTTGQAFTFCTGDIELNSDAPVVFSSHTGC